VEHPLKRNLFAHFVTALFLLALIPLAGRSQSASTQPLPPKTALPKSGLELERRTQAGSFFDVAGRRAVAVGYEHRGMETWVYPLKIADDFKLAFKIEGYPLEFDGADILTWIKVRPEATTFTYSHAAFTVRQTIFAPIDEPGIVILLDIESALPIEVIGSFRPKLSLMWPAGLMTGNVDFNKTEKVYYIVEESNRFTGIIGSPALKDVSVMPYQEEPRDVPTRFVIDLTNDSLRKHYIPIVISGSVEGRAKARETYQKLLNNIRPLYERTVAHYRQLNEGTLSITTPDERLNTAFAWAKVGIDKGLATNPSLGTGLVAGFRTSGNSERPGFAWYFGRDALWTSLAINSYGDFAATKTSLEFLKKVQRADGKIPHEISQSAGLIPWFSDYVYPWASADATPLYIIAHADYLRASGDREFTRASWDSIRTAYRFSLSTDTDGNSLIENTKFGHGWVEGGRLYPAHEEIYHQGLWIEALRSLAMMAGALGIDAKLAEEAKQQAERVRQTVERIYWIEAKKIYAFATNLPRAEPGDDEQSEKNPAVKARMRELRESRLIDEATVLPAVPMWWRLLDEPRADLMLDRIGGAEMSADWGARILSKNSPIYDPLSYHYGSVWPLFTGWASMAAYRYHRPQIGYDYLMANALLTYDNALGYVTELLSGDFNQAFGRSSHHQVWSCAMVVTPLVRGLLGLEADATGNRITVAPQIPDSWDEVRVNNFRLGEQRWDLTMRRSSADVASGARTLHLTARRQQPSSSRTERTEFSFELPFPPGSEVVSVGQDHKFNMVRGLHHSTCQFRITTSAENPDQMNVAVNYLPGIEVLTERQAARPGDTSQSLKLLSTSIDGNTARIVTEGRGGRTYDFKVRSRMPIQKIINAEKGPSPKTQGSSNETTLRITMPETESGGYVRQTVQLELGQR
jgi:glycogen debranching enzyme